MALSSIGTAYVQVMPSMEGVAPKVESYFGGAGIGAGKSFASSMGTALTVGLGAAAAAAGVIIKESLGEGAGLQQSIGGIETMFGAGGKSIEEYAASVGAGVREVEGQYQYLINAQEQVLENARNAYKTAGMSANEYMENVTSFSAALIKSLGGDTRKAAEVANMALVDLSDNANKFGTDAESLTMAYQGFAKGQYQLLDNLKLGYGGTKTEMERLLTDAQALTGIEYNIDNLADVYSAIHVIQEELGITGTTAKEASSTLTGSFTSMKAAAQNVLGNLALGQPMEASLEALKETTQTFLIGNLMPMVGNVFDGLPGLIEDGVEGMITWIGNPGNIAMVLSAMWDFGSSLVGAIWNGIVSGMGNVYKQWPELFAGLNANMHYQNTGNVPSPAIPGYATGLDYVPYDNFVARLHEGEMVLTKAQANAVRNGQTGGGNVIVNQYFYDHYKTAADQQAAARYEQEKAVLGLG